jgi:hypothetical protein
MSLADKVADFVADVVELTVFCVVVLQLPLLEEEDVGVELGR